MSSKRAKKTSGGGGPIWRSDTFVGLSVMLLVLALHASTDLFAGLERRFYDWGVSSSARLPSDRIAVIAIDDRSVANIGRWPWPREVHAELIDKLAAAGAKTIAHTAFFFEPQTDRGLTELRTLQSRIDGSAATEPPIRDLSDTARTEIQTFIRQAEQRLDADARLEQSMRGAGNVIVPSLFSLGEPQGRPYKGSGSQPMSFARPARTRVLPTPHIPNGLTIAPATEVRQGPQGTGAIMPDKGKVRVSVSLFGRPTSVELDYLQLKGH